MSFPSPWVLRARLEARSTGAAPLGVGPPERGAGAPATPWPESVDEALGFGSIGGAAT